MFRRIYIIALLSFFTVTLACQQASQPERPYTDWPKAGSILTASIVTKPTEAEKAKEKEQEAEANRTEAMLEKMAAEKEKEVLAGKDEYNKKVHQEHDQDVASYQFKVARWGNWLELSIARGKKKFSTSINLELVTTLHLEKGTEVSEDMEVWYSVIQVQNGSAENEDAEEANCYHGESMLKLMKGYHWVVKPRYSLVPERFVFEETEPKTDVFGRDIRIQNGMLYSGFGCTTVALDKKTKDFARYSQDDVIHFDGIAMLYVPAGLGERVYRQILEVKEKN